MALTSAQKLTVYHACGLRAEGGTYYLVRFTPYTQTDIEDTSISFSYADVKTLIDTQLAALSSDANTWLGTHLTTYDSTVTSSFVMKGEVNLDDAQEFEKARAVIQDTVGVHVEAVDLIEESRGKSARGLQGRVTR